MQATPELHKRLVMGLLDIVHNILTYNKVQYFIEGGTLLGAMREGEMIAHDDDADIVVWKSWKRVIDLIPTFRTMVLGVDGEIYGIHAEAADPWLVKVYINVPNLWVQLPAADGLPERIVGCPTLDIFRYQEYKGRLRLYHPGDRLRFKACWHSLEDTLPLTLCSMKGLNSKVYRPKDPMPFLLRYYGKDCMEVKRYDNRDLAQPQFKSAI